MTQAQLVALLRTPAGLGWLVLATLLGAVGLAIVMAMHLSFFEGTRKLVYPEPAGRTVLLAQRLERGEITALGATDAQALVRYALADDPALGDRSWMPEALAKVAPGAVTAEVELALLAGTPAQAARALELVRAADLDSAAPTLARLERRASSRGETATQAAIAATLAHLSATAGDDPD